MPVLIHGRYTGDLNVTAEHAPSGTTLHTAAPVDNHGDGSSFSPTDLVATALGTCVLTVMAIAARAGDIPFEGATYRVEKHMKPNPRRIAALPIVVGMPPGLTPEQRQRLEQAGRHCPVHHSLHPDVDAPVAFEYPSGDA